MKICLIASSEFYQSSIFADIHKIVNPPKLPKSIKNSLPWNVTMQQIIHKKIIKSR